jgi:hypothetical protein
MNQDLLQNITTVTNREEEDAVFLPVSRDEVFKEAFLHPTLRGHFNAELRKLEKGGFVVLTRKTVALTDEGFKGAWE